MSTLFVCHYVMLGVAVCHVFAVANGCFGRKIVKNGFGKGFALIKNENENDKT